KSIPTRYSSFTDYGPGTGKGIFYYAKVTNDTLTMGYDSLVILDGSTKEVTFVEDATDCYGKYNNENIPRYLDRLAEQAVNNLESLCHKNMDLETYETSPAFNGSQIEIPADTKNGDYPTTMIDGPVYSKVMFYLGGEKVINGGIGQTSEKKPDGDGVMIEPAYSCNDPVIVKTPVVSPVSLYKHGESESAPNVDNIIYSSGGAVAANAETTQLISNPEPGHTQFRLDGDYWFEFDPREHMKTQGYVRIDRDGGIFDNAWEDDDIKFDKYVKAKYVHFPFDVYIYVEDPATGKEIAYYEPYVTNDEDDDQYWIKIYSDSSESGVDLSNNIQDTHFYIPPWAQEGTGKIRYRVDAVNVASGDEASADGWNNIGDGAIAYKDYYIATYDIPVQLSGWIYDFEIVGTNTKDTRDLAGITSVWEGVKQSLASLVQEKKSGILNRLGDDKRYLNLDITGNNWTGKSTYVRQDKADNTGKRLVTNAWPRYNTIVMDMSKDGAIADATKSINGTPPKGTEFTFTLKTMSNLWDKNNYIDITPTFRWYSDDGSQALDQENGLHVFYNDSSKGSKKVLVEYGMDNNQSLDRIKVDPNSGKIYDGNNNGFQEAFGTDNLAKTVSLADVMFNDTYDISDIKDTMIFESLNNDHNEYVKHGRKSGVISYGNDYRQILDRSVYSYSLSKIYLTPQQ
ncbi:MAG: hypothetical protein IK123_11900, partial [Lachnospiraceae bacterium]|nr:hypothetical protein [Lachnospiraceae bacterium]